MSEVEELNLATTIAFLRAINVGGHNIRMTALRELFEELGLEQVETFIASGNVIFESAARKRETLESRIENHLEASLGYPVTTFIRSIPELHAIVSHQPFPPADVAGAHGVYVGMLKTVPEKGAKEKLLALQNDLHRFHLHGRELYWLSRIRMGESRISGVQIERALAMPTTMRSVTTLGKLAAKLV